MTELLIPLMQEYQRLLEINTKYKEWTEENPEKSSWQYKGQRISRARLERIGVIIRKTMIDYEKSVKR